MKRFKIKLSGLRKAGSRRRPTFKDAELFLSAMRFNEGRPARVHLTVHDREKDKILSIEVDAFELAAYIMGLVPVGNIHRLEEDISGEYLDHWEYFSNLAAKEAEHLRKRAEDE